MEYLINQHGSKDKEHPRIDQCPLCRNKLVAPSDDAEKFSVYGFTPETGTFWFELTCEKCGESVTHYGDYSYSETMGED